jgi:hypothetical protein
MRSDGTFLEEWRLPPGTHQEGITFQDSNLVISQDNGPVFRYPFFPLIVPEPSTLVLLLIGLVAVTIRCRL